MQQEFNKTLELFDVFARQLGHVGADHQLSSVEMNADIKNELKSVNGTLSDKSKTQAVTSHGTQSIFGGKKNRVDGKLKLDEIMRIEQKP